MRHLISAFFVLFALAGIVRPAAAVSDAPLRVLTAYIEANNCGEQVTDWERKNGSRAISGELSRDFVYRVLGFIDWGRCGRPFFKPVFIELQKVWRIYAKGYVNEHEFEVKESELINLLFAAIEAGDKGPAMVKRYEQRIAAKLIRLVPEHQYFNCTYFGDQPKCTD